jgi:hypothetical protein
MLDPQGLFGEFSYHRRSLAFKDFLKENNLEMNYVYHGENKVRLDPTKDLKPEDSKWFISASCNNCIGCKTF